MPRRAPVRAAFLFMASTTEWDERFRRGDHASSEIDPFLSESKRYWALLNGGATPSGSTFSGKRAVDLACGAGRHAVYLAEAGFDVTAVDFSEEGLASARRLAESREVSIETVALDLEADGIDLGEQTYDLAVVFFYLHRPLFPRIARCLRPGGLVIYKTYSVDQLRYPGCPRHRIHMLEHNELLKVFSEFRVLRYEEEWEGKGTAALVAQK